MSDYAAWAELRAASRGHLTPWEPLWARDELSRNAFRRRIRHYSREAREDLGYAFFIFATAKTAALSMQSAAARRAANMLWPSQDLGGSPILVGGITFSHVRRGVTQAATLGYWLGKSFVGRGLMSDALSAALPFAFDVLRLHRVEAAVMPNNTPSLQVLEHAGFVREGIARRYLKINGHWQDHIILARLAEDDDRMEALLP